MRSRSDRPHRPFRPRCVILGMILAWIVALYVPAFLIAATGTIGDINPFAAMWALTDRIALPAKLAFAALFAALILASRRVPVGPHFRIAADAALGALAMLLVLALLPEGWSRGIGIGLTGQRFDPATLPWYLLGGALAGPVFTLADRKCGELSAR
jgi:hypothetical protein